MKTLFIFDLHIIRHNVNEYYAHAKRIFDLINRYDIESGLWNGIEPYLFINSITKIDTTSNSRIIKIDNSTQSLLNSKFNNDWNNESICQWCDVMNGSQSSKLIYFGILKKIVQQYGFECLVYWGTNKTIQDFCKLIGIHSISLELGPTRYPIYETCYCDFLGVNGQAYTKYLEPNDFNEFDSISWLNSNGIQYKSGKRYDAIHNVIHSKYANELLDNSKTKILLALQLMDDSNCLIHSKYDSMFSMLQDVLHKLVNNGFKVFIKPHPAANQNNKNRLCNYNDTVKCKQYISNFIKSVYWLDDVCVDEYVSLIDKIDATVSINSSIGFESMLFNKPVIALGTAPYAFGKHKNNLDDLLTKKCFSSNSLAYQRKIINILLNYYLYPFNTLNNPTLLANAILRNIKLAKCFYNTNEHFSTMIKNNPIQIIEYP